jgi:protein-disulfide isomerase
VLYLAPDRRYISTAIYDRLSDPLTEEKLQQEQVAKLLIGTNSPSRGSKTPTVTIVEFSDFQCPYCQRIADVLEKEVLPSDPEVRMVFRNFPLPIHPFARHAAEVAACAGMQNTEAFWTLHDYIFSHQRELTADNVGNKLMEIAGEQSGIDHKLFQQCVENGWTVGPVAKDEELGHRLSVHATPTLFINGSRIEGVRDAVQLKQLIAAAKAGQLSLTQIESQPIANNNARSVTTGKGCGVITSSPKGGTQ